MRKVVGIHSSREALKVRPKSVARILLKQSWERSPELDEIAELAKKSRVSIKTVPVGELDKLAHGHQGVCAEVLESPELDWKSLEAPGKQVLLGLDGIEDPQNLGAILRSTWVLGGQGILVPSSRALSMTPTVAKIACGGAEHVPVEVHSNLLTPLTQLKEKGFWVYGLSEKADKTLWDVTIPDKVIWVVGAEGQGVRKSTLGICDELVTIPQVLADASLNASVSAAIALAETQRRWRAP